LFTVQVTFSPYPKIVIKFYTHDFNEFAIFIRDMLVDDCLVH